MSILVIAEHDNAALKAATLNTITAATQLRERGTINAPLLDRAVVRRAFG